MPPGQVLQMKAENVSLAPGGALCSGVQRLDKVKLWFTAEIVQALQLMGPLCNLGEELGPYGCVAWCNHCTSGGLLAHSRILQPGAKSVKSL